MKEYYNYFKDKNFTNIPIFLEPNTDEEAGKVKDKFT